MGPEVVSGINEITSLFTGLGVLVAAVVSVIKPLRTWILDKVSSKKEIIAANEALTNLNKKFDSQSEKQELITDATLSLTRNSLTRIYYKAIEHGGISDYDRQNFMKMYDSYSALGGNSYVHELRDQIVKMKTLIPKVARRTRRTSSKKR